MKIKKTSLTKMVMVALALAIMPVSANANGYPNKPIKITVPFGAGGGTDTLTRTLQPFIETALGANLVILNAPGAGSVTGSRTVIGRDPDGYTVLINHATLLTNMAVGKTNFDLSAFDIAASTTSIPLVVAVPAHSAINSLADVANALKGNKPVIAGVNIGAINHFAMLMLGAELNSGDFRYVQTGGGAKTIAALLGNQISIGVLSGAEAKPLQESGEVKIIAALSQKRIPYLADVPTASEQGSAIDFSIEHSWYFPAGTPSDVLATFAKALEKALQNKELLAILDQRGITPTFFGTDVAPKRVASTLDELTQAAKLIKK